jgi:hypothetical protein
MVADCSFLFMDAENAVACINAVKCTRKKRQAISVVS